MTTVTLKTNCPRCGKIIPPAAAAAAAAKKGGWINCITCIDGRKYTFNVREPVVDPSAVVTPRSVASVGGRGILTDEDLRDLRAATQRVADLMGDGDWYTADQIRAAAGKDGKPASEGLRRMRELREHADVEIEKRKIPGSRLWEYRLVRRMS